MHVGPSDQQLEHEKHINSHVDETTFSDSLSSLSREELVTKCVQLHLEIGVHKNQIHSLRAQLAAVALKAEEEDERNVLRLSREISKKNEQIANLIRSYICVFS